VVPLQLVFFDLWWCLESLPHRVCSDLPQEKHDSLAKVMHELTDAVTPYSLVGVQGQMTSLVLDLVILESKDSLEP
jgi:hypothetical protein